MRMGTLLEISARCASPDRPSRPAGRVRENAMFCAECRVLQANRQCRETRAWDRPRSIAAACMPPIEPPTTENSVSIPKRSSSHGLRAAPCPEW